MVDTLRRRSNRRLEFDALNSNFDDLDTRVVALEQGGGGSGSGILDGGTPSSTYSGEPGIDLGGVS